MRLSSSSMPGRRGRDRLRSRWAGAHRVPQSRRSDSGHCTTTWCPRCGELADTLRDMGEAGELPPVASLTRVYNEPDAIERFLTRRVEILG